jgi:tetratricopeptide (TPR) repeat protein
MLPRGGSKKGKAGGDDDGSDKNPIAMIDAAPQVVMTTPDAVPQIVEPSTDIGKKLAECRGYVTAEDWTKLLICANEALKTAPGNPDFQNLAEQAKREAQNKLQADTLNTAVKNNNWGAARDAFGKIGSDSVYYEKAKAAHDKLRDDYVRDQEQWAQRMADKHDCKAIDTRMKTLVWDEAKTAVGAIQCDKASGGNGGTTTNPPPECRKDSDCGSSDKECKSNKCVAKTVTTPPPPDCDANALLDEARNAGSANQWSKVLSKAEASNKCQASKIARQLALLAACQLGNRDKALKYWKEFENNTGMQQRCIGVVK